MGIFDMNINVDLATVPFETNHLQLYKNIT